MDSKILIILAIILFILVILNHVSVVVTPSSSEKEYSPSEQFGYIQTPSNCSNVPGCCSLTQYGCCPDGVNSRTNALGSNCPTTYSMGYNNVDNNSATIIQNNATTNVKTTYIPPQNIIKPIIV
jgi:hypothetical protein